jgi:hypothetical protein
MQKRKMGGGFPPIHRCYSYKIIKPACKPHSVPVYTQVVIIYLGELSLTRSRDLPGCRTERATPLSRKTRQFTLLDLAPGGVCRSKGITALAGSLLHYRFTLAGDEPGVLIRQYTSLLHFPSGCPARPLAGTVLLGVRTFLDLIS